jgi:hypothetical protein
MDEPRQEELTLDELEAVDAEPLPDREAMSVIDPLRPMPLDPTLVGTDPPDPGPEAL